MKSRIIAMYEERERESRQRKSMRRRRKTKSDAEPECNHIFITWEKADESSYIIEGRGERRRAEKH